MTAIVRVLADGSLTAAGAKLGYDSAGLPFFTQDPNDTDKLTIDWTGFLGTETISTAVWSALGLTVAGSATSGKTTSANVSAVPSNSMGEVSVLLTTSGGRIKTLSVRFYGRDA